MTEEYNRLKNRIQKLVIELCVKKNDCPMEDDMSCARCLLGEICDLKIQQKDLLLKEIKKTNWV